MPSIKTTYILVALSIAYVVLFLFTVDTPGHSLGYAIGRVLFIWVVAGMVVAIRWGYCKLFKKQGDYLAQLNWSASVMFVLSLILWFRAL